MVADTRELLLARAEQIREYERRNGEIAAERNALHERVSNLQAALIEYESKYKEADQTRAAYVERNEALARTLTAHEAALAQAADANATFADRVGALEATRAAEKQATDQKIEELAATLRREKLGRAVAEGALETARKDFSRLIREVKAMRQNPPAPGEPTPPRAANAA